VVAFRRIIFLLSLNVGLEHNVMMNIQLSGSGMNNFLENPRIMRDDLLVVVLVYPNFLEAVTLVKFLCTVIRNLHMKVYLVDRRFCMRRRSSKN
jgi:hypothetical protein